MRGIALFAVVFALFAAFAHAAPVSLPSSCNQINSSFAVCRDGTPITIGFSVTGPNEPGFGNFQVIQVGNSTLSEPIDSFGNQCIVASSQTNYCYATLNPIPLTSGNGTQEYMVRLLLKSIPYPQLTFNRTFNITISHYIDRNDSIFISEYLSTLAAYQNENNTYSYFCDAYGICDKNIAYNIGIAGVYLDLSGYNIDHGTVTQAIFNTSVANRSITDGQQSYQLFINTSNNVVHNVVLSNYLLAKEYNYYEGNESRLNNCSVGGSTYGNNIRTEIANAESYPMQNSLNGSARYLGLVRNISTYEIQAVKSCKSGKPLASPLGTAGSIWPEAIIAIIAIIIVIYVILVYRGHQEVKRIRGESSSEEPAIEETDGEEPAPEEKGKGKE